MDEVIIPRRAMPAPRAEAFSPILPEDAPLRLFGLLAEGIAGGLPAALVTLVETSGGNPRPIGAQMAVLGDGRYAGYVSGGCVESALAAEAIRLIGLGHDGLIRFGAGSPFLDIKLPCEGSIELLVHVNPREALIADAHRLVRQRRPFTIRFAPDSGAARLASTGLEGSRTGWDGDEFVCSYVPATHLVLIGRGVEMEQALRLAAATGVEITALCGDDDSERLALRLGLVTIRLGAAHDIPDLTIDRWSAVIVLFHDHEREHALLRMALESQAFFIGAMGSARTHARRCERLRADGVPESAIARIRGPVGLFGPTRDASALALSVLAELVERRRQFDGR
jgi:xanthine dehydrogenase accessory factor